ncbi:MAG TPA: outer membrane beta-barrel protein [Flavisolibacter sp.]|jgi:hypothetical protein|nr:outer membrane beta-barrel protein [Flavisolibacter sp.]
MQFINDDIDQLFRRAAEEYPLNTNSADWSKVQKALQSDNKKPNKQKGRFFILFLLAASLWTINTFVGYVDTSNRHSQSPITNKNNKSLSTPMVQNNQVTAHSIPIQSVAAINDPSHITSNNRGTVNNRLNTPTFGFNKTGRSNILIDRSGYLNNERNVGNLPDKLTNTTFNNNIQSPFLTVNKIKERINGPQYLKPFVINIPFLTSTHKRIPNLDAGQSTIINTKTNTPQDKGFYFGLTAGMDISNVKLQKTSNIGYSAGILLGYDLNNKWGIESGILWDQKSYYSNGKYFNPKLWPYMDIKNVDGVCKMLEIPVNVKYRFSNNAKRSLYVMAGASSYIMKKESYNYTYQVGQISAEGYKTYENSSRNWFSVMNIGLGYSFKPGKLGTAHIEPYAKIPLGGLGIGQLPISSFGINFSFTKSIGK